MHIRTDDEVYRVDAVWLGPPRATFPWRARYSAYGVGLIVMIVVMFLQRRIGIPLGFFSVAWALLITVGVTRFVSRRINDERPLLEWLTLFAHELRGPRARTRSVGGALSTGGVRIHRDRPHGPAPAVERPIALPPGSTPAGSARVLGAAGSAPAPPAWSASDHAPSAPTTPRPRRAERPLADAPRRTQTGHDTPARGTSAPAHGARRQAARSARRRADAGFGPPSATEIGEPVPSRRPDDDQPALPPAPAPGSVAPAMAAWTTEAPPREPLRVPGHRMDTRARHAEPVRAPGGTAGFGPGARRRRGADEDDGAPA